MEKYNYPAIFTYEDDTIYIEFPDFENCFTDASNEDEAFFYAQEILELCMYDMDQKRLELPKRKDIQQMKLKSNQVIVLFTVSMKQVRDKVRNEYVKKTLTLPKWLDELGKENKVNFSMLLQNAIIDYLGLGK